MLKTFTPLTYRFRSKLACEIAGIDQSRLNESIAAKDGYKCAPETRPGVAREFGEFDLIALFVFRQLTMAGFSQSLASMYACNILSALNAHYMTLPERFDCPMNPFPDELVACQENDPTTFQHQGNLLSYATISFNIPLLRKEIQSRMQSVADRERNTFGAGE